MSVRAAKLLGIAAVAACAVLALLVLLPAALGYQRYVITGGSMSGSFDRGSLVYEDVVPVSDLKVGDVITYTPPPGAGPTGKVTHRIVSIGRRTHGGLTFRTKGDANRSADPWTFKLDRPEQARAAFHVPYVGYLLDALQVRAIRMLLIGVPALLIAIALLLGTWREAGAEARARNEVPA